VRIIKTKQESVEANAPLSRLTRLTLFFPRLGFATELERSFDMENEKNLYQQLVDLLAVESMKTIK
jgi:hypothetical protein